MSVDSDPKIGTWRRIGPAGRGRKHYIVARTPDGEYGTTACGLERNDWREPAGAKVCDICMRRYFEAKDNRR